MKLSGKHFLGSQTSQQGESYFHALNPTTGAILEPAFMEATTAEIDRAIRQAEAAFLPYAQLASEQRADFLEAIAAAILALGDDLLQRAHAETGLPLGRLQGERGRTMNQLKRFAQVVREGSWVGARIDLADPDRPGVPKPDIRQMQIPLGPVAIFGASNFPLAFSVAGGDTASALAAACPVVVKAHPAHPGTSEAIGQAILAAAAQTHMPEGVFSLLHGRSHEVGMTMVRHPLIQAVGFTGSLGGGRALFDAAARRSHPIPVYAEMGSVNPVFILPQAMEVRGKEIAQGLARSITLGTGQFCTNPGLVFGLGGDAWQAFTQTLANHISSSDPGTMLTRGIKEAYNSGIARLSQADTIQQIASGPRTPTHEGAQAQVFSVAAKEGAGIPFLTEEVFGPSSVLVHSSSRAELLAQAEQLEGQLTATIHGTEAELADYTDLIAILQRKVGRLLFNGFPTGVEVCDSMVHGGPYPATTDARTTSVGTAAIFRFARPVCYQNFPQAALPAALRDENPIGIWRLVNGEMSRGAI